MKDEIMKRVSLTLKALNNVSVCGKSNLVNLSGAISLLEEAEALLRSAEISDDTH